MRDLNRMKEKLEVVLDGRQLAGLATSVLIVAGAAFIVGVMIGRRMGAEDMGPREDALSALDKKAEELSVATVDASLVFQDELMGAPTTAEAPPAAPPPTSDPSSAPPAPRAVAAPSTSDPEPVVTGRGAYTLQLSASQDPAESKRFASRLKERGYAPYIVEAEVEGRGRWFRVRMGHFATKDAATRYLADFRRETGLSAFVAETKRGTNEQ